jgi:hypothetical protein
MLKLSNNSLAKSVMIIRFGNVLIKIRFATPRLDIVCNLLLQILKRLDYQNQKRQQYKEKPSV